MSTRLIFACIVVSFITTSESYGEGLPVNLMPRQASIEQINLSAKIKAAVERIPVAGENSQQADKTITLTFDSEPRGASIYINGIYYGKLPYKTTYFLNEIQKITGKITLSDRFVADWGKGITERGPTVINTHRGNNQKYIFVMPESEKYKKPDYVVDKRAEGQSNRKYGLQNEMAPHVEHQDKMKFLTGHGGGDMSIGVK